MDIRTGPDLPPVYTLANAISAAEDGVMPPFTSDELVASLGLAGDTSDGRTLMDRFTGDDHDAPAMRVAVGLMLAAPDFIQKTNDRETNPAEEAIGVALGVVITRQLEREGDICPGVRGLVELSTREDYVSPETRSLLAADALPDDKHLAP